MKVNIEREELYPDYIIDTSNNEFMRDEQIDIPDSLIKEYVEIRQKFLNVRSQLKVFLEQ